MSVQLIGDEIYFRGELVAVLVQSGISATAMGDFTDQLEEQFVTEHPAKCDCPHEIGCDNYRAEIGTPMGKVLDKFVEDVKEIAKGGLIRYEQLKRFLADIKEEEGLE